MACELVRLNQGNDNSVYFPISDAASTLDAAIKQKNFHRAGQDAINLLKSFAPYRGGNIALRAIHDLDIHDKHKAIIPTVSHFAISVVLQFKDGLIDLDRSIVTVDPDSIDIVFPKKSPFSGEKVIPTLEQLVQLVDGIVQAFSDLASLRT